MLKTLNSLRILGFWTYGHESLFAHYLIQAEAIPAMSTLYGLCHSLIVLFMVCVTVLMVRVRVRLELGLVCHVCQGLHGLHQGFNGLSAMVCVRVLMACLLMVYW